MFHVLKRVVPVARHILFAGAVALLWAGWGGTALAGKHFSVPELSPGSVGGAMTLLAGGLLLVREQLRSRR